MLIFLCILGWYVIGVIFVSLYRYKQKKQIFYEDIPFIIVLGLGGPLMTILYIGIFIGDFFTKNNNKVIFPRPKNKIKEVKIKKLKIHSRAEILDI